MRRTSYFASRLRAAPLVFVLGLVGVAPLGCVDTSDEVAFAPTGGTTDAAPGCDGAEPPDGQLRGLVYAVPTVTRRLPDFRSLRPFGAICTESLGVTERRGYPGFPGIRGRYEWFAIDFQGTFVVTEPGLFHFRLTSDDGTKLFIDGAQVIDNDGFHVTRTAESAVYLAAGPHGIAVPFWQGPGPLALILEVARPGEPYEVFQVNRPLEGGAP